MPHAQDPFLLRVENLRVSFEKGIPVLRNLNFTLNRGEWVILAGPNGSGKTVLMNHLNGLDKPAGGRILYEGRNINTMGDEIRARVGLVFQNSDWQFVEQTVKKELIFGPRNLGLAREEREERARRVMDKLGLHHLADRRPHTLSGGEKKRVAIGGILTMEPDVLVLDEPFTGLDWKGVDQVLQTLTALHREGMTLLLITHDLAKCAAQATRIALMDRGEIVLTGPLGDILPRMEEFGVKRPGELTWLK